LNKVWVASVALIISMSIIGLSSESAFAGGPVIEISKDVDKPIIISGTEVKYTYNFKNNGLQTLLDCSLTDSQLGPIPLDAASVRLSPGETGTADKSTNIIGTTINDATLSCELDDGSVVAMTSNTVTVTVVAGAATIDKTASKTENQKGDDPLQVTAANLVFFFYEVENTGTATLLNCVVTDSQTGLGIVNNIPSPLVPGGTGTAHSTNGQLFASNGQNTGTLSCDLLTTMGTDVLTPVMDTANVQVVEPKVSLVKTASKTENQKGDDPLQVTAANLVFFFYEVENTGDVDLTGCVVTDSQTGLDIVNNIPDPLVPGGTGTSHSTTGKLFASNAQNLGTVTCMDPWPMERTGTDTANVEVVEPKVSLDKFVNGVPGPLEVSPGDFVTYSFVVKNTGDVPLTDCTVTDPLPNLIIINDIPSTLAAGAEHTVFSSIFQVNSDECPIVNQATVTCMDPWPMERSDMSLQVTVTCERNACLDLVKFADNTLVNPGDTVKYTYDVTNCGDVDLECGFVDDNKLGDVSGGDIGLLPAMAGPASSVTFMQPDIPIFVTTKNTADLVCTFGEGEMITAMDMETVTVIFVGGEFLPIDSTALLLAGLQTSAIWILPAVAGLAGTGYYLIRFRSKQE